MKAVIITGASKGFGRAVALAFANSNQPIHFVLHGRDESDLNATKSLLESVNTSSNKYDLVIGDLADANYLSNAGSHLFDRFDNNSYSEIYFINNAGSLGTLACVGSDVHNLHDFSTAINLNVTASCYLTHEFVKRIQIENYVKLCSSFHIVNVSSLAAIKPFETWSIYCAGKAARDMYHKTLAEELKTKSNIRSVKVLNYAPGPLDTNMQKEIREGKLVDKNTQEFFINMKKENQLVDPMVSASKLISAMSSRPFENGDHLDYFDL